MTRILSLFAISMALSTPALAIQEYNRPQILYGAMGVFQGYNALQFQLPISDSGAISIGYMYGAADALNYADATSMSVAYKAYFLPGKASYYKVGAAYVQDNASSNTRYAPVLSMGMDLTAPSSPLVVNFEAGIFNQSAGMLELNVGMRF